MAHLAIEVVGRLGRRIVDLAGFGEDRDPAVSQTIRRRGISHTAAEEMWIEVDVLVTGRYELVISVFDRLTTEAAHMSSEFFKTQ